MNGISLLGIITHNTSPRTETALDAQSVATSAGSGMSWSEVAGRIENGKPAPKSDVLQGGGAARQTDKVTQLAELLRVQTELHRHQIRVEFLSKISESAMATLRKLQQN